jgi:hypothetical protein
VIFILSLLSRTSQLSGADNQAEIQYDSPIPDTYPTLYSSHCTPHNPILVNSNSDLLALGLPGSGSSWSDPIIIQDYYITSTDPSITSLILLENVDLHFLIDNNCLEGDTSGISIRNSKNGNITRNEIVDNTGAGIDIDNSSNLGIVGNLIENTFDNGIKIKSSNNVQVFDNTVLTQDGSGLQISDSANITVVSNLFAFSYSIYIHANISIFHSNIVNYTVFGLEIKAGSSMNDIKCNFFLYNNNSNTQASDDGVSNNVDYNHWSDWLTPDVSPADGIVDDPYLLTGTANNQDDHPFVSPNDVASSAACVTPQFETLDGEKEVPFIMGPEVGIFLIAIIFLRKKRFVH